MVIITQGLILQVSLKNLEIQDIHLKSQGSTITRAQGIMEEAVVAVMEAEEAMYLIRVNRPILRRLVNLMDQAIIPVRAIAVRRILARKKVAAVMVVERKVEGQVQILHPRIAIIHLHRASLFKVNLRRANLVRLHL